MLQLGGKRVREEINEKRDNLNKNSQRVKAGRNAKIARLRKFGNEHDKSADRGHQPIPTEKHEV